MSVMTNGTEGGTVWQTVNWREANREVRNLRQRIFRATQQGDWRRVNSLQKLMLRCRANRLVAVRRVTQTNQGKRTPGVDRVLVKTPAARGKLVDDLATFQPWRAQPTRRVFIPKANGKRRPLGIPTMRDRALQAMVKNALEPSWEARFEATSYGFRPGRGCHDAVQRLWVLLKGKTRKNWVVDADIKGAFDNIDHEYLLKTIGPVPGRELIRQWLKAGYVDDKGDLYPTDTGTPQGGVISPLLANIALHGMEEVLGIKYRADRTGLQSYSHLAVVRYADDFVVACTSKEEAEGVIDRLTPWLAQRGLTFSEEKTRITTIQDGFDFLGYTIRQFKAPGTKKSGTVLLFKPSRKSVKKLCTRLREEWMAQHGHSVAVVVSKLNPIIRGWANYFRNASSSKTFNWLDDWMFRREIRYVKYTHPQKPWKWQRRYWGRWNRQREDNWVFGNKDRNLLKFSWFKIQRHILVMGTASPDDPGLQRYWEGRKKLHAHELPPKGQQVARAQRYTCDVCGESLFNEELLHLHHIEWRKSGGTNWVSNLGYRHLYCHQQIHAKGAIQP
jgi:RNA-directed DNA polymerase